MSIKKPLKRGFFIGGFLGAAFSKGERKTFYGHGRKKSHDKKSKECEHGGGHHDCGLGHAHAANTRRFAKIMPKKKSIGGQCANSQQEKCQENECKKKRKNARNHAAIVAEFSIALVF
jgi:hypothetical protein